MITLGIHDGHTATACLLENGEIIACISEERLNRDKEWSGFPEKAIEKCLEITGKTSDEVKGIGICSEMPQIGNDSWHEPPMHKKIFSLLTKVTPENLLQSPKNIDIFSKIGSVLFKNRKAALIEKLAKMGFETHSKLFFDHHLLHAATAYYMNWYKNHRDLVITLDGSGDAVCGSILIGQNGKLDLISKVFNYNSICEFYTRITQFLGMKPMSHEFKVMGMAPYASDSRRLKLLEDFRKYYKISDKDPLQFLNTSGYWKWQFTGEFKKKLVGQRFDWVAGAVQDFYEEIALQWIKNALDHTKIRHLVLSGGGFMNVKLNYLISKWPKLESLFIFPSCGDESNAIGASILAALKAGFPYEEIKPLGMVYWGPSYSNEEVKIAIDKHLSGNGIKVKYEDKIIESVAQEVANGKIVGRFAGRMEWGARALGNRSILADPRDQKVIHRLNNAIKMRDFWMPFAPAILIDYREKYLDLRPDFKCPFMTIAPDTKPRAWDDIPAGLHPFDKSARAQILDPDNHPEFYAIVKKFEEITGVGGVLNTSYNLHGDPIVCTPEDAIYTFLNSELDILQMENYIIEK